MNFNDFYICMLYAGEPEAVRLSKLPNLVVIEDTDKVTNSFPIKCRISSVRRLEQDFASQRNSVHGILPKGAWLCWLDADEEVWTESFLAGLNTLMADQRDFDCGRITRINTVTNSDGMIVCGSIETHCRIYRNFPYIKWEGKIHEQLTGFRNQAPDFAQLTVNHCKTQERQDSQTRFYAGF